MKEDMKKKWGRPLWKGLLQVVKTHLRSTFDLRTSIITLTILFSVSIGVHTVQAKVENSSLLYRIYYEGKYIGTVKDLSLIRQRVSTLDQEIQAHVSWTEVRQPVSPGMNDWEVVYALDDELHKKRNAVAIQVDGRNVVTVADKETAGQVMDEIKNRFSAGDTNARFVQKIQFVNVTAEPQQILTFDGAVELLLHGSVKPQRYIVSRGDTLWTIAAKSRLSIDALKSANPEIMDENSIAEGEVLNLNANQPLVTVESVEDTERTVPIDYDIQYQEDSSLPAGQTRVVSEGQTGQKKQWVRQTKHNGTVVNEVVLREEILRDKVDQVIARGTKERGVASRVWVWPTSSHVITSPYGEWRGNESHPGVDIGAPTGSPVWASNSGRVVFANWDEGGYGLCVRIDHGNGVLSIYAHLSSIQVSVGDVVDKGQAIGNVGMTGEATGPHLHYEVHVNGVRVNPAPYM